MPEGAIEPVADFQAWVDTPAGDVPVLLAAFPNAVQPEISPQHVAKAGSLSQAEAATSQPVDPEQLEQAIKAVNEFVDRVSPGLQFPVDKDSDRVVVKVVDPATQKVQRQFPSQEMLQIAEAIGNIKGLLIHQNA